MSGEKSMARSTKNYVGTVFNACLLSEEFFNQCQLRTITESKQAVVLFKQSPSLPTFSGTVDPADLSNIPLYMKNALEEFGSVERMVQNVQGKMLF